MPLAEDLERALEMIRRGAAAEAESLLRRVAQNGEASAEALNVLAFSVQQQGRIPESAELWAKASALEPDRADLYSNLAGAQLMLRREVDAASSARRAIEIDPTRADAHANLGSALRRLGDWEGAIDSLRSAVRLRPDFASYRNNLGDILQQTGQIEEAIEVLRSVVERHPDNLKARSDLLMAMNYSDRISAADLAAEAGRFGAAAASMVAGREFDHPSRSGRAGGLRIGFVSGDLRSHSVARFLPDVLAGLKARGAELLAYPTRPGEDETTLRLKPLFARWTPIDQLRDSEAARTIATDGLDILVDLSGHSGGNRLGVFAFRPAPVQVTWIGYSGTTGVPQMDYILADRLVLPEVDAPQFSERAARLPGCYLLFTPPREAPEVPPLPATSSGRVTFGSFNNLAKLSDATLDVWARILRGVPDSRLVLKSPTLPQATAHRLMASRFAARGVSPDRIEVLGRIPDAASHLAAYGGIDIALDPFPYAGTTTTFEALWMGRPVVSLRGDRFTARVGDSILSNLGLNDWVGADVEQYVAIARSKAGDLKELAALSSGLRQRMRLSPLGDGERFVDTLMTTFTGMLGAADRGR